MSKSTSGPIKAPETSSTGRLSVAEGPWQTDWQNYDPDREPGDAIADKRLFRRKRRLVERRFDLSTNAAAAALRNGNIEIADAEVV